MIRITVFLLTWFSSSLALAVKPVPLIADGPNPNAPAEVKEYGQLQGTWSCKGKAKQADGSWSEVPGTATWSWYYILDGYAVQDVWQPPENAGPNSAMGTNLRTFDPETGVWEMVWTTQKQPRIEKYKANYRNNEIHMYAERPAYGQRKVHLMHITFYNISDTHFDWKYETSAITDGKNWNEVYQIACDKPAGS